MTTKQPFKGRTMRTKKLPVSKLDMDPQNPRLLNDAVDQEDAMTSMLTTTGDKCMELLRDITTVGELSSSDLPIVVAEGNRYVVLEGNRRLLCLRLWRKPKLIEQLGEAGQPYANRVRSYIEKSDYTAPDHIEVVIAESREDAEDWIDKRHGLGGSGSGTVQWDSFQRDRRRSQKDLARTSRAYAFISFLTHQFRDDVELMASVWEMVDEQYTTLERVLGDTAFRSALGLQFEAGAVTLQHGIQGSMDALKQLVDDLAMSTHNSRSLHSGSQRAKYADTLAELVKVGGTPFYGDAPAAPPSSPTPQSGAKGGKNTEVDPKPGKRRRRVSSKIFKGLSIDQFPTRLQDLSEEMSTLDTRKLPEVTAAALRVLLDLTMEDFERQVSVTKKGTISERVVKIIDLTDPQSAGNTGQVQTWPPLKELRNRCAADELKILQLGVHSAQMTNLPDEVKGWADRIQPLLVAMNEYLGNNKNP